MHASALSFVIALSLCWSFSWSCSGWFVGLLVCFLLVGWSTLIGRLYGWFLNPRTHAPSRKPQVTLLDNLNIHPGFQNQTNFAKRIEQLYPETIGSTSLSLFGVLVVVLSLSVVECVYLRFVFGSLMWAHIAKMKHERLDTSLNHKKNIWNR